MYCDYNASAPLRSCVKDAITAFSLHTTSPCTFLGNPSSVHTYGRHMRSYIEEARESIAHYFNVVPKCVIFTSGATEANNMVIKQHDGPVFISSVEHDSIAMARTDAQIINVDDQGVIDLDHLASLLESHKACLQESALLPHPNEKQFSSSHQRTYTQRPLVAVMAANNETGVIQPLDALFDLCESYGAWVHVDAVQALGKMHFDYKRASTISVSGHKIGALTGVGALIKREDYPLKAFIQGGGQERSYRAGTENILGILTFGVAIKDLAHDDWSHVDRLRLKLEEMIMNEAPNAVIFGKDAPRLPNTIDIAMPNARSELQLMLFDQQEIAISSGSACSSGKVKTSRILKAMGVDESLISNAVRISFGPDLNESMIQRFFEVWLSLYHKYDGKNEQKTKHSQSYSLHSASLTSHSFGNNFVQTHNDHAPTMHIS